MVNKRIRIITIGIGLIGLILPIYTSLAASLLNQTYLPMIAKQPAVNPPGIIPNGDFEQGPVIWAQYSSNDYDVIYPQQELPPEVTPYDGIWVAWLAGVYNEISYIEQQVFVSSSLPYLSYWYRIIPSEGCVNGLGMVIVNSGVVAVHNLCTATGGWVQGVINLSAFAEQSVLIQFRGETDGFTNSDLFFDHIAFQGAPMENNSAIK
ncbi:MAG: hypothetical protein A2Y88_10595 [Chloroflexi bacterium RBG_13_48_10]|nr:MAG: hypothetical protein A2Y88_10595 [Chloroflexi bacterium RBG_13_48_10]